MNYLRFVLLAIMVAVIFASCMGEPAVAEIVYDNKSDSVVKPLEDNAVDLYSGKKAAYRFEFINSSGSTVLGFGYIQDGKEFQYPGDIEGPYIRIHPNETKTVEIYNGYYKIR